MRFEKKLIILSGSNDVEKAKGTLSLERNAYGLFATLNIYNLPNLQTGIYRVGLKTNEAIFLKDLGQSGRILARFEIGQMDISLVHAVVFCDVLQEAILYGTTSPIKLWQANRMDGFRSVKAAAINVSDGSVSGDGKDRVSFDEQIEEQIEHREDNNVDSIINNSDNNSSNNITSFDVDFNYSGKSPIEPNSRNIRDYFFDITPTEKNGGIVEATSEEQPTNDNLEDVAATAIDTQDSFSFSSYNDNKLADFNFYDNIENVSTNEDNTTFANPTNPIEQYFKDIIKQAEIAEQQQSQLKAQPNHLGLKVNLGSNSPHALTEVTAAEDFQMSTIAKTEIPPLSALNLDYAKTGLHNNAVPTISAAYHEKIALELGELFEKNERHELLEKLMPDTKWVKVGFDESRYYVVGIIGKNPEHICYGVPGVYSETAPHDLGDNAKWLPINPAAPTEGGYWLMFQDAITGEVS